jgi:hypothetical protein
MGAKNWLTGAAVLAGVGALVGAGVGAGVGHDDVLTIRLATEHVDIAVVL